MEEGMIVIVDYGMGNLGSILNMLRKAGADAVISSSEADIEAADKLILPGVGAFDSGMRNLAERGLIQLLNRKVIEGGTPIMGICLGMQLFTKKSEEGSLPGLGWINAGTKKFRFVAGSPLKVPHMGWNVINIKRQSYIFSDMYEEPRFYFVHSYYVSCADEDDVLATTNHGIDFVSALQSGNVIGVQFHPEKSHKFGLRLLKNYAGL